MSVNPRAIILDSKIQTLRSNIKIYENSIKKQTEIITLNRNKASRSSNSAFRQQCYTIIEARNRAIAEYRTKKANAERSIAKYMSERGRL